MIELYSRTKIYNQLFNNESNQIEVPSTQILIAFKNHHISNQIKSSQEYVSRLDSLHPREILSREISQINPDQILYKQMVQEQLDDGVIQKEFSKLAHQSSVYIPSFELSTILELNHIYFPIDGILLFIIKKSLEYIQSQNFDYF